MDEEVMEELVDTLMVVGGIEKADAVRALTENNWNFEDALAACDTSNAPRDGLRHRKGKGIDTRRQAGHDGQDFVAEDRGDGLATAQNVGKIASLFENLLAPLRFFTGFNGTVSSKIAACEFSKEYQKIASLSAGDIKDSEPMNQEGDHLSRSSKKIDFYVASYKQASVKASQEGKVLFVYLHCAKHPATELFCKDILSKVSDLVNQTTIPWGGNVEYSDAYILSSLLGVETYPCIAILEPPSDPQKGTAQLVIRMEGAIQSEHIHERLLSALNHYERVVSQREAARFQLNERERIRREQDEAYARTIEEDRIKAQEQKDAEESERRALEEKEARAKEIENKRANLLPEIAANEAEPGTSIKICFQFKCGKRVQRLFLDDATIQNLRDFVDVTLHDDSEDLEPYALVQNYPKKYFGPKDELNRTLRECGLAPRVILYVRHIDSSSDEE